MNIFIGSSTEAKADVKHIALIIEDLGHKPIPWYNPGVFAANKYTMENLEELQDKIDAAIFVFNEDDKIWYRDNVFTTVRDNVLLEYGMFSGALSRNNVCFCCRGNPKIASDLKGITYIPLEKQQRAQIEIEEWIKKLKRPLKQINSTRVESFYDAINYAQKNMRLKHYESLLFLLQDLFLCYVQILSCI